MTEAEVAAADQYEAALAAYRKKNDDKTRAAYHKTRDALAAARAEARKDR